MNPESEEERKDRIRTSIRLCLVAGRYDQLMLMWSAYPEMFGWSQRQALVEAGYLEFDSVAGKYGPSAAYEVMSA